jgi:hypothetical protein
LDDQAGEFDAGVDVEFAEDLSEVEADGVGGEVKVGGDLAVGETLGDEVGGSEFGAVLRLSQRHTSRFWSVRIWEALWFFEKGA